MEVYANEAWKKESDKYTYSCEWCWPFFLIKGEKIFGLFLYKRCVHGFMLDKKKLWLRTVWFGKLKFLAMHECFDNINKIFDHKWRIISWGKKTKSALIG